MRNQAALFRAKTKAATPAPKPRATVADKLAGTLAASSARGTEVQPKAGAKPPTDPTATGRKAISEVSPEIRRAAGITTGAVASDPLITFDSVGMSIGARLCDPKTARDYLAGKVGA